MSSALEHHSAGHVAFDGDLSRAACADLARAARIAWDIETSGLDWSNDRIALCQLQAGNLPPMIVRVGERRPPRLASLLENSRITKVFHHAMFDLRFMAHHWAASPSNIACTKIAAKLLFPNEPEEQKLQRLLSRFLDVAIDKSERMSNWFAPAYSAAQIAYAVADVVHLGELLDAMMIELDARALRPLAERCFAHVPTRVELETRGFGDVFQY